MKKQGSILIEVMASIMILSLTSAFIVRTSIQNTKTLKERILLEEVNRSVSNLINEFKYNISKEEIERLLKEDKIGFKYDEDFSKKLSDVSVNSLEKGEAIQVLKVNEDEAGMNLKIVANIKNEMCEVNVEKVFTKSWWMDEI